MLEGRVLRTSDHREFAQASWDGVNRSRIYPLDDKVLVLMDEHAGVTLGGVIIADDIRDRQSMASETGVIIAVGEAAFQFSDDGRRRWDTRKPQPGERVMVERYAGKTLQGYDGIEYRIMSQSCIAAIFDTA
jgi:chaperonin GroES